jgi:hypothetical protein
LGVQGVVGSPDLGMSTSRTSRRVKPKELYIIFPNVVKPLQKNCQPTQQ